MGSPGAHVGESRSGGVGSGASAQILLVMRESRDRELLVEWLDSMPGYGIETVAPREGIAPDAAFDLCVVDARGFDAVRGAIDRHRAAADPMFLPCLLVVTGATERDRDAIETAAGSTVDDVVTLPMRKAALGRRIGNLLRARRSSVRLVEREEQYAGLVQQTPEAILLVRDDELVYANAAAGDMLGVAPPTELRGQSLRSFVHPDDREALDRLLTQVADGLDEFVAIRFDPAAGDVVETETTGVTVRYEGEQVVQLLARDVTERERQRRRLDLFRRAVETAAQGITIADAAADDLPIVYANEAFERITGYPVEEILGRNCRFLQGENTDPETVRSIREAIDEERPISTEILNYRRDGTPFWNQLDIVPVHDDEGEVGHFLGLQRDITERKEREERLFVLDRVLRHNIRNRVNVIQGYAERLVDGVAPTEGERIFDAAEELIRISQQVRRFRSIVSADEQELETFDLAALVASAVETVRTDYPQAAIQFECTEALPVHAHPLLPTAIEELLGLVAASGREGAGVEVTVRARRQGDEVVLELCDRGGTVPASDLRVVQEGQATVLDHPRGLELWLVRWAVLYSDGVFEVDEDADPPVVRMRLHAPPDGEA